MNWGILMGDKNNSIGEVASVEGDVIEVFVYPEKFHKVRVGSILLIDSEYVKPMGVVLKLSHSSRYGSFTPLRQTRSEIDAAYPDLKNYHKFVTSVAYTSVLDDETVRHFRKSMPLLHDLVYIIEDEDLLERFMKPEGDWDFRFLEYFVKAGATHVEIREFFLNHLDFFKKRVGEFEDIVQSITRYLGRRSFDALQIVIEEFEEALRI
mgnify:CR=1 FL=1